MAFVENPLSLSIPQATFEAWLREHGYLETLDRCVLDNAWSGGPGICSSLLRFMINPFKGVTVEDLSKRPVAWTGEFWDCGLGLGESYGLPLSGTQLKLRMEENMKRYMGNYLRLFLCIFLCVLYSMPLALLGVISILGLWDTVRMLSRRIESDGFPKFLLVLGKIGTAVIVIYCKVALAICWAAFFTFTVVILHGSLRKITPLKGSSRKSEQKHS
eukprot:c19444_g1_i1 orf=496-1143(+)